MAGLALAAGATLAGLLVRRRGSRLVAGVAACGCAAVIFLNSSCSPRPTDEGHIKRDYRDRHAVAPQAVVLQRLVSEKQHAEDDRRGEPQPQSAAISPVVGVFGATDPELLFPPGAPLRAVTSPAGCRFCWPRRTLAWPDGACPLERHECMAAITTREVARAILDRLPGKVRATA